MARVFVTGVTGCLGHALAHALLAQGHDVWGLVRNAEAAADLAQAGVRLVTGDICQGLAVETLQGVEQLYHCAGLSSAWGLREAFYQSNVLATKSLLRVAASARVGRFIFASSPSIYADGQDRFHLSETAPLPKVMPSAYAHSKFRAETLVLAADRPEGMRCISLRPRAIYGRGDRSLLPRLLAAIKRGRVPMIEGGRAQIDLTHVSDAAQAFLLAGQSQIGGRAFNVTSGEIFTLAQIVARVCELSGHNPRYIALSYRQALTAAKAMEAFHRTFMPKREPVLSRQVVASLGRSLTLDISAARTELGYAPKITLDQGIQDYADVW